MMPDKPIVHPNATKQPRLIHDWFSLSYANYLILHRSILQSMPDEWQARFVELLDELDEAYGELPDLPASWMIRAKDSSGSFVKDPYADYQRGRRKVEKP